MKRLFIEGNSLHSELSGTFQMPPGKLNCQTPLTRNNKISARYAIHATIAKCPRHIVGRAAPDLPIQTHAPFPTLLGRS